MFLGSNLKVEFVRRVCTSGRAFAYFFSSIFFLIDFTRCKCHAQKFNSNKHIYNVKFGVCVYKYKTISQPRLMELINAGGK